MDAVLGLSVTPSAVGLVLVDGQDADGAAANGDAFEIYPGRRSTPQQMSQEAAAAVLRTEVIAANRGRRLQSIGITWSENADLEASLLLKSLGEYGFDNVVPVQLPEASEAVAWGVADIVGCDVTAVCIVESETVIALIVHAAEGAVQTAVNHSIDTEDSLVRWLSAVFARADWRPEALVMVGSGADFDELMPRLEGALSVPVFAPAEAQLALARGAALAMAHNAEAGLGPSSDSFAGMREVERPSRQRLARTGPLAMLAAGTVAFVVSVSAAISMQLAPDRYSTPVQPAPAAKSSPEAAAAVDPPPAAPLVPAAPPEAVEEPAEVSPPPAQVAPESPEAVVDVEPAPETTPAPEIAPAAVPPPPVPGAPALPPESLAPGLVPAIPTPVPERRGILQRIRDRLDFGNDNAAVPPAVPPPLEMAPPPPPEPAPPPPPPA